MLLLKNQKDNIINHPTKDPYDLWVPQKILPIISERLDIWDIKNNVKIEIKEENWKIYFYFRWYTIGFIEYNNSKWSILIEYFSNINFNNNTLKSKHPSYHNLTKELSKEYFWQLKINWLWTYMFNEFIKQRIILWTMKSLKRLLIQWVF